MDELTIALPKELKSKFASKLIGDALVKLVKQDILSRFLKTGKLSAEDQEFCDEIGWYPVDEMELREEYVEKLERQIKEPVGKSMMLEEFNKWCE